MKAESKRDGLTAGLISFGFMFVVIALMSLIDFTLYQQRFTMIGFYENFMDGALNYMVAFGWSLFISTVIATVAMMITELENTKNTNKYN